MKGADMTLQKLRITVLVFGLLPVFSAGSVLAQDFETIKVRREGAVLFADLSAPPMNLLGTEMVRDLVALIQRAEADNAI
jgi:hypothetical protein